MKRFIELTGIDNIKYCINIDGISMITPNIESNNEINGTKIYLNNGRLCYFKNIYKEILNEINVNNEYR